MSLNLGEVFGTVHTDVLLASPDPETELPAPARAGIGLSVLSVWLFLFGWSLRKTGKEGKKAILALSGNRAK